MEVILVRHGETAWNEAGLYQGWEDPPLSPAGRTTARTLGIWLRTLLPPEAALWSSDLRRAVETAWLAFGREPRADARLRELDFGRFAGATYEENLSRHGRGFEEWVAHRGRPAPPGVESLAAFRRRTNAWLRAVREEGVPALAVTHGGVIRTLARPFADAEIWPRNGEAVVLHLEPGRLVRLERRAPPSDTAAVEPHA